MWKVSKSGDDSIFSARITTIVPLMPTQQHQLMISMNVSSQGSNTGGGVEGGFPDLPTTYRHSWHYNSSACVTPPPFKGG